ncbi:MarR family winged helix-turn-helix transcriptional regulator [Streptomyces sp. NBC_01180]|uniref:MarR family winged helix-turn-helix transcriptional regulator n=1 Tax=Streptomyces sp. NBC_01180 TaxID=2903763 RepID=UPI00386CC9E3|nr:MarR family transcriptional regulator [Streptomyces sp. NBC_01180]
MTLDPADPHSRSQDAAEAARDVIELLDILWEHGRDAVSTAPVSSSQLRVMYVLDRGEGINLRTLSEALGATPSSVSRLCDRLQAVGFVRRGSNPVSRREVELRLTTRGRSHLYTLRARREEVLLATVAKMEPGARGALLDGLAGFRKAVDDETGPVQPRMELRDTPRSA